MNIYRFILVIAVIALSGCIPYPHTSDRFPGMQGHVIDATTGQPISDVIVAVHDHPSTTAKTDKSGFFSISKRQNYHLGVTVGMCGSDWPEGSHWSNLLDVSRAGYVPSKIDASDLIIPSHDYDKPYELHDILLTPQTR